MKGKDKCKILKEIRAEIARQNDIAWVTEECRHKGDCTGTCPKCEAELRKLEQELELRRKLGRTVAVLGIAAGMTIAATGCTPLDKLDGDVVAPEGGITTLDATVEVLDGDIAVPEQ